MNERPTYSEAMKGERINADESPSIFAKLMIETLSIRNMEFYQKHILPNQQKETEAKKEIDEIK